MWTLGLLAILAGGAAAQDDPAPGDRIEVTFPSGGTIIGKLVAAPQGAPAGSLTLDVTSEYPGIHGTLTVPKPDIVNVRKLRAVVVPKHDPGASDIVPPKTRPVPATPAVDVPETPKPAPADPKAQAEEELKKALEMYAKFPEPDWGPERRNAIKLKQYRGQLPTPLEREFLAGYDLWEKGREAAKKK